MSLIRPPGPGKAPARALLLVAAAAVACADSLAPDPTRPFALTTDRARYRGGETVIVRGRNLSGGVVRFDPCVRYLVRDLPGPAPAASDTVAMMVYDRLVELPTNQVFACDVAGGSRIMKGERLTTKVILPAGGAPSLTYRVVLEGLRGEDGREFADEARSTGHFEVAP